VKVHHHEFEGSAQDLLVDLHC